MSRCKKSEQGKENSPEELSELLWRVAGNGEGAWEGLWPCVLLNSPHGL